jgi:hypothetical protein
MKGIESMKHRVIEEIIKEEWQQFQLLNNEGGRASCQDDWKQFMIMRKSQFTPWPENILDSYFEDLAKAKFEGRNLLFEKYAWMMEKTSPDQFKEISHTLPYISKERKERVEKSAFIQAKWGEEFALKYPNMADKGRVFYSKDDTPYSTSIETYARGELLSYSEKTEILYSEFILFNEENGINLNEAVRENMVISYGYNSLEHYEKTHGGSSIGLAN